MNRRRRFLAPMVEFLRTEASGGVILLAATLIGLIWANSPWSETYERFWHTSVTLRFGQESWQFDLRHVINDGLMVLFFFVVGLEIKREFVVGELRQPKVAILPILAAATGMAVPAAVYLATVWGGEGVRGWGVPMATDIAFAVGVLALLGSRIPYGLKVFLLTLAIVDDIGAILVIALFYSQSIQWIGLAAAAGVLAACLLLRRLGVAHPLWYVPLGVLAWLAVLASGVHATITGVALGLLTPARPFQGRPVHEEIEHYLHPWTSYFVIPVFALANAGVSLALGDIRSAFAGRVTWGILLGLVIGKWLGVAGGTSLAHRLRIGRLPNDVKRRHIYGVGALAGIGFTVALFIATLAFSDNGVLLSHAKIGILAGSSISGIIGAGWLARTKAG